MRKIFMLTLIFVFIGYSNVMASTTIGGNITEDTVWDLEGSPYIVESTVQVFEEVTLEIKPGVEIRFDEGIGLTVGGELIAKGTSDNMITFTSNKDNNSWSGITFINSSIDAKINNNSTYQNGSIIKHSLFDTMEEGVIVEHSSPYITNSKFNDNLNNAIKIYGNSNPVIIKCNISNNKNGVLCKKCNPVILQNNISNNNIGIESRSSAEPIIKNNLISDNFYGIHIYYHSSNFQIKYNKIINNNGSGDSFVDKAGGITVTEGCAGSILYNVISNNSGKYGALFIENSSPNIEHNYIKNNSLPSIFINGSGNTAVGSSWVEGLTINHNNFDANTNNEFMKLGEYIDIDINCTNNYWNLFSEKEINNIIYDHYDDITLGKIAYKPFQENLISDAISFSAGSLKIKLYDYNTNEPITSAKIFTKNNLALKHISSGEYVYDNMIPGNYTLTASAPLYHNKTIENVSVQPAQTTTQDFELEKMTTGAVTGKVLNTKDTSPLQNQQVILENDDQSYQTVTSNSGEYSFDNVKAGEYNLSINSTSYYGVSKNVTVNIDDVSNSSMSALSEIEVNDIENLYTGETYVNALKDLNATKNNQISELQQTVNNQNQTINSLNQTIVEKNNKIQNLNNTIDNMYTESELDNAITQAKAGMYTPQEYNNALATLNATKNQKISGLQQTVKNKNQTISNLNSTLVSKTQVISDLNATKTQKINNLKQSLNNQNQTIANLNGTLMNKTSKISNLNSTLANKTQTISKLNATISNLKSEIKSWDVNNNDKIDMGDIIHLLKIVAGDNE